jgi:Subtilase family/Fibronectin type-III domain/Peptidase inhibitor I9/PA domain
MRIRAALLVSVAASAVLFALPAAGAPSAQPTQLYIVQMLQDPVVAYAGGIPGLEATKPAKGKKVDPKSNKVAKYVAHLNTKHNAALSNVGGGQKLYDYNFSYNGFAARLTDAQAESLEKQSGVLAVTPNQLQEVDTATTPTFLGLDKKKGLWDQLGGPTSSNPKQEGAGENIIIGVVDSGITPESVSFTDRKIKKNGLGKVTYGEVIVGPPPEGWAGTCGAGENFTTANCNNKLIGARHFNAAWGGDAALEAQRPWEFQSARDYNGHGTHTTSTAGGNFGVPTTGTASIVGDSANGIAPRARVAAYKALWSTQDASTASGFTADLTAAIDQAVEDGVDVINYSVSGTQTNFLDPVQVSFLFAADAGVFVSVSAGNSGPGAGTVAHPSPWYTTVAAETHDRVGEGSAVVDGVTYAGASAGTGSASGQLTTFGAPGSPQRLCFLNSLNAATAAGKIVFCERGTNARVEKSFEVQRVGGIGMILVNPTPNSLNADLHFVPTVHLQNDHYAAIEAAALAGKSASVSGRIVYPAPAPFMATFSSRGPSPAADGDVLKPDLGAPGVDVLAAVAPPGNRGREFDLYSGTSMSAPHVAGLGALFKQLHPNWSPMAIKSALMTTGSDVLDTFAGTSVADASGHRAFAQGAGHVQPNTAANPGLVYDSDARDWLAFLCGSTSGVNPATCASLAAQGYSFRPSDMNLASIQVNGLAGTETVKRRVTNVGSKTATYTASSSISGISVVVTPSSLTLAPGETKSFEVRFTRTNAPLNVYTAGSLTWTSGQTKVRSPIVVRPVPLSAPAEVTSNGSPVSWQVTPGYDGPLSAAVGGLIPATQTAYTVADDPDDTFAPVPASTADTFRFEVSVPNGALLRAGIFEDAITPTGTDLDMYVFRGTTFVAQSADGDSNEVVTTRNTTGAAATYIVYVHGFDTGAAPSASGTLFTWVIGATQADAGNTTISGVTPAQSGVSQTHTATFSGLAANTRYLGEVRYSDASSVIGRTLLNVRTP